MTEGHVVQAEIHALDQETDDRHMTPRRSRARKRRALVKPKRYQEHQRSDVTKNEKRQRVAIAEARLGYGVTSRPKNKENHGRQGQPKRLTARRVRSSRRCVRARACMALGGFCRLGQTGIGEKMRLRSIASRPPCRTRRPPQARDYASPSALTCAQVSSSVFLAPEISSSTSSRLIVRGGAITIRSQQARMMRPCRRLTSRQ
jgi:hypothetical protein